MDAFYDLPFDLNGAATSRRHCAFCESPGHLRFFEDDQTGVPLSGRPPPPEAFDGQITEPYICPDCTADWVGILVSAHARGLYRRSELPRLPRLHNDGYPYTTQHPPGSCGWCDCWPSQIRRDPGGRLRGALLGDPPICDDCLLRCAKTGLNENLDTARNRLGRASKELEADPENAGLNLEVEALRTLVAQPGATLASALASPTHADRAEDLLREARCAETFQDMLGNALPVRYRDLGEAAGLIVLAIQEQDPGQREKKISEAIKPRARGGAMPFFSLPDPNGGAPSLGFLQAPDGRRLSEYGVTETQWERLQRIAGALADGREIPESEAHYLRSTFGSEEWPMRWFGGRVRP